MSEADIDKFKEDIVFEVTLRGRRMCFHSTWGMFSPRRIDDGTYMLIEKAQVAPDDISLDLGCGYGSIGLAIAGDCPAGRVHMVDRDFLAVEYAHKNAGLNALGNCDIYLSNAFSHVPADIQFNNILANLPANVGKEMLSIILHDARARLAPGGKLYVVTIAGLRKFIRRNFEEVFGNYDKLKQGKTYAVALAVKE